MKINKVDNFINTLIIFATLSFEKWYPLFDTYVRSGGFFSTLLRYILLFFSCCFIGEILSIIKIFSPWRNKRLEKIKNSESIVIGFIKLLFLPLLMIPLLFLSLSFIGIVYSLYVEFKKPYAISFLVVICGILNGFAIGMEKYYEKNEIVEKKLIRKIKNKVLYSSEKPYDNSFSSMIPIFMVIFFIFYPINYIVEYFIQHISIIVIMYVVLSVICFKLYTIFYEKLFVQYELENDNNITVTIIYVFYSIFCFIGYIYYNTSMDIIVSEAINQNSFKVSGKIMLLIITGYLPIKVIPIIISGQYKWFEKVIHTLVVGIYILKKYI
jgi:hypothetical protein